MSTVLCSAATGPHTQMLDISEPTLHRYAERWGMDVHVERSCDPSRPPSWSKLLLIGRLLERHTTVVWLDADALFVNFDRDLRHAMSPYQSRPLWMVKHKAEGMPGLIPNCGVLVVHQDTRVERFLDAVWRSTEYIDHPWWEQAAIMSLIGYKVESTHAEWQDETDWTPLVGWLGTEWNSMPRHDPHPDPVIRHWSGMSLPERIEGMTKDAANG